jgi:hypothetical protein
VPGHLSYVVSLVVHELFKPVYFVWLIISSFLCICRRLRFSAVGKNDQFSKNIFYIRLYECRRFLVSNTGNCEIVLFAYARRALIDISFSKINIVYWSVHDYVKIQC